MWLCPSLSAGRLAGGCQPPAALHRAANSRQQGCVSVVWSTRCGLEWHGNGHTSQLPCAAVLSCVACVWGAMGTRVQALGMTQLHPAFADEGLGGCPYPLSGWQKSAKVLLPRCCWCMHGAEDAPTPPTCCGDHALMRPWLRGWLCGWQFEGCAPDQPLLLAVPKTLPFPLTCDVHNIPELLWSAGRCGVGPWAGRKGVCCC